MRELPIRNFRSVGAYPVKYGGHIIPGRIFRGGPLCDLKEEDCASFRDEYKIRYVLDLRDENETYRMEDTGIEGVDWELIPALPREDEGPGFDFDTQLKTRETDPQIARMERYMISMYQRMPFHNPAYARLFERMLEKNENVYFHCSAGKDRTGIGAFLIMTALGASEEDGIKEYLKSNEYIYAHLDEILAHIPMRGMSKEAILKLITVSEEYINAAIDAIYKVYPDMETFLEKEYGLTETKRAKLRKTYCSDDNLG